MPNEIISAVLGKLTQDKDLPEWWVSAEIEIPLLNNQKLPVTFSDCEPEYDASFVQEADQALINFLKIGENYKREVSHMVYMYCQDFISAVGEDYVDKAIRDMEEPDVWNFIYFRSVMVERRHRRDQDIYITLAGGCDWEQEHGFQLVFRQGRKLTRVSYQDGHLTEADAYNKSDDQDKLLAAF